MEDSSLCYPSLPCLNYSSIKLKRHKGYIFYLKVPFELVIHIYPD